MNIFVLESVVRVSELWTGLLSLAGVAVLVLLAILIAKLIKILAAVGKIVEDIAPTVTTTVNKLPQTMDNINLIVGNFVDVTDDVTEAITPLMASTTEVGTSAEKLISRLNGLLTDVVGIAHNAVHYFDRSEREKRLAANSSWSQVSKAAGSAYTAYKALKKSGIIGKR